MESSFYSFPSIEKMRDIPLLGVPDYTVLNNRFLEALVKPENHIYRSNPENGHPVFGAYYQCESNEMVTWAILLLGEYLCARNVEALSISFSDFYDAHCGVYINSPGHLYIEYWYLFYVNALAGAVFSRVFSNNTLFLSHVETAANTLMNLAKNRAYDFNAQGFDFSCQRSFTSKDIFRQPDSIAGYAYNMLFAGLWTGKSELISEAKQSLKQYQRFEHNPWYEIPNGSAGLLAASWLSAHGENFDIPKIAGWIFDHEEGPLQIGYWGKECVDGLMMGWRGEDRDYALSSAYSMETLMPLQFLLPSVRYCPALAKAAAKFTLNALSAFQLFFAEGQEKIYQTMPNQCEDIPYEKLVQERDGHTPAACGDFWGQRSVYGAGYMLWLEALAVKTSVHNIYALDLSVTDWLSKQTYPVYLLQNPYCEPRDVSFEPPDIWKKSPLLNDLQDVTILDAMRNKSLSKGALPVKITLAAGECVIIALLPQDLKVTEEKGMLLVNGFEIINRIKGRELNI